MDKILRIKMKSEGEPEISTEELGDYAGLGGRALTSAIVSKEVPPTCHPLGEDNKLVIAPGLLSGSAAVMILIGLIFWISSGILEISKWNIFLNPYNMPDSLNPIMWSEVLFYNRLYLSIGSILAILAGLYRLQHREKYV